MRKRLVLSKLEIWASGYAMKRELHQLLYTRFSPNPNLALWSGSKKHSMRRGVWLQMVSLCFFFDIADGSELGMLAAMTMSLREAWRRERHRLKWERERERERGESVLLKSEAKMKRKMITRIASMDGWGVNDLGH